MDSMLAIQNLSKGDLMTLAQRNYPAFLQLQRLMDSEPRVNNNYSVMYNQISHLTDEVNRLKNIIEIDQDRKRDYNEKRVLELENKIKEMEDEERKKNIELQNRRMDNLDRINTHLSEQLGELANIVRSLSSGRT